MMAGIPNPMLWGGGDPLDELGKIERSVRLRSAATAHFSRTFAAPTNQKKWTWACWVKRGRVNPGITDTMICAATDVNNKSYLRFESNGPLVFSDVVSGSATSSKVSSALFRDVASHNHVVMHYDTDNATAADRIRLYVGGVRITSFSSSTDPTLGYAGRINSAMAHTIGRQVTEYLDGYLSHIAFIDGKNIDPSAFCQSHPRTGQWRPKSKAAIRAAVAAGGGPRNGWGTNGFFLPFDDITSLTTLGYDRSQSDTDTTGNNWTANNISLTAGATYDSMLDTPTNVLPTFNPLVPTVSSAVLKNGNLTVGGVNGTFARVVSTQPVSAGVVIWEAQTAGNVGIVKLPLLSMTSNGSFGSGANEYAYRSDGQKNLNGTTSAYGAPFSSADVITGVLDLDAGTLAFYKNGISQGVAFSGLSGVFLVGMDQGSSGGDGNINFGQRPFSHPVAGAKVICTKNLPLFSGAVTISGTFIGNLSANGPLVWMNGSPETLTINGNPVTFGTHADKLSNGFKLRTASSSYNASGNNTWTATILSPSIKSLFRYQNARGNP